MSKASPSSGVHCCCITLCTWENWSRLHLHSKCAIFQFASLKCEGNKQIWENYQGVLPWQWYEQEGRVRERFFRVWKRNWMRKACISFRFVTVTVAVITLAGGCTVDILGHKDLVRKMQWWGEESYPDFKKNKGYLWVGSMLWWWCFSKVIKSGCLWQSTPLPSCSLEVVNTASGLDPVQVGQMMPRATVHYFSKVDQGPHVLQSSGDILQNAVIDVLNQNIWKWDQRKWIFKINLSKLLCTKVWEFLFQGSPLSSQRPAPSSHKIIIAMNK